VKPISTVGHKYGLAPIGCVSVLWRENARPARGLGFSVPYFGGSVGTRQNLATLCQTWEELEIRKLINLCCPVLPDAGKDIIGKQRRISRCDHDRRESPRA
jgi:hypothetical protein